MGRKEKSGSHRKVDTAKHHKRRKRELENRGYKDQQRIMAEFEFAQRLPDIHVPEVKNEEDSGSTGTSPGRSPGNR